MEKHRNDFRVAKMAKALKASLNGYCRWRRHGCPDEGEKDKESMEAIREIREKNKYRTGGPNVHDDLTEPGLKIGGNKTARLMRENGLGCRTKKAFRVTTKADGTKTAAADVPRRDFTADRVNQKWVGDITCPATSRGFVCLCVIIDLYARRAVGWSLSQKIDAHLARNAPRRAFIAKGVPKGAIVHSDRGR